jgi:hypothetical protein
MTLPALSENLHLKSVINRGLSVDDFSSFLQLAKRFGFFSGFLNEPRAA